MKLQSLRLDLAPLTAAKLSLAVNDYEELQRQLGLKAISTPLDEEMLYAMRVRHSKVLQDQENYLWLTNWAIIQQEDQTEKDNVASHQVLKHLGAQQYRETEDLFWWRIAKKKRHP